MPSALKSPTLERLRTLLNAGDATGACAFLASHHWNKYDAAHPLFEILHSSHKVSGPVMGQLLDALVQGGWNPRSLTSGTLPYPGQGTRAEQNQMSAPFLSRTSILASLPRRIAGLPRVEHRHACAQTLEAHGVGPDPGAWREAYSRSDFGLLEFWKSKGHTPPEPAKRFEMAATTQHYGSVPAYTLANAARVLDELAAEGWTPSEEEMGALVQRARDGTPLVFLAAWLERYPDPRSWSVAQRAQTLETLWAGLGSGLSERETVALTARLLEYPAWVEALAAPTTTFIEFIGTPAEGKDWPVWNALFHPLKNKAAPALSAVVLPHVAAPHDRVGSHSRTEIWASSRYSPRDIAAHPLASFAPHPETGRWPAAGANRSLDEWMEACGGWAAAALDPRGPWPEITARIVKERRTDFVVPWCRALRALSPEARQSLTSCFEGMTVAEWASGRADLAEVWRETASPAPASSSVQADLRAVLLAGSVPRVRAVLKKVAASDKVLWSTPAFNPLTWVLAHDWGQDGGVRRRVVSLVSQLHAAGAPWPTDRSLWQQSVLFGSKRGWSSTLQDLDIKEWKSWRQWPACLALSWARAARAEMSDRKPDLRLIAPALAVLDHAEPGAANQALLVFMQTGLDEARLPYPDMGALPYPVAAENLALLVPELVRRVVLPLGFDPRVIREAWNAKDASAPLARFWNECETIEALSAAAALGQDLPESRPPSRRHRL